MPKIGPRVPGNEWKEPLKWAQDRDLKPEQMNTVLGEAARISLVINHLFVAASIGLDQQKSAIVDASKNIASVQSADIAKLDWVLETAVPVTEQNAGLHAHLDIAGIYARNLAIAVREATGASLPEYVLEAAGKLNDVGKLTGIFRYHFNDVLGDSIMDIMRIRPEIQKMFMPTEFHVGPLSKEEYQSLSKKNRGRYMRRYCRKILRNLTLEQKIFIYADVCGKPTGPDFDDIQTFNGMRAAHLASRGSGAAYQQYIGKKEPLWPSEIYGINHIEGFAEGWMWIYEQIREEFERMGVNLEEVRVAVKNEWLESRGRKEILAVKKGA